MKKRSFTSLIAIVTLAVTSLFAFSNAQQTLFAGAPAANDPYWANVVGLWHFNGVNGSGSFPDSSSLNGHAGHNLTSTNTTHLRLCNTQGTPFGAGTGLCGDSVASGTGLGTGGVVDWNFGTSDFTVEWWTYNTTGCVPFSWMPKVTTASPTHFGVQMINAGDGLGGPGYLVDSAFNTNYRKFVIPAGADTGTWNFWVLERISGVWIGTRNGIALTQSSFAGNGFPAFTNLSPSPALGFGDIYTDGSSGCAWNGIAAELRVTRAV